MKFLENGSRLQPPTSRREQQQAMHFSQAPRITKSLSPADRESGCAQPELGSARGNLVLAVKLLAERL